MKALSLITSAALAAFGAGSAFGGSVTLTSAGGRHFADKDGTVLAGGTAIRVGAFNLPDATRDETLRHTSDYAKLASWFKPLGESIAGSGTVMQANGAGAQLRANGFPNEGDVFGTVANVTSGYMAAGTQLYVWVFDAADPRDATQWGIFTSPGWVAPPALGATALSTQVAVEALQGETIADQLRLAAPAPTYGNWAMKQFPANASGTVTAFDADPDGDGIQNIAEYAWQLNPNAKDGTRTSLSGEAAGGATFTFKTPRNLADVTVTAECSSDLQNWSAAASTITASDEEFDTHTCAAAPGADRYFWRVRFSAAP